jgi:hypothetical protein
MKPLLSSSASSSHSEGTFIAEQPAAESGLTLDRSRVLAAIRDGVRILLATFREIFDESAYQRFLRRHQLSASRNSYAAFRLESEAAKARRPRCC